MLKHLLDLLATFAPFLLFGMAGKTQTHENAVLNYLRATNLTAPANAYVGLFTANPTDTTGGTEVTGNAYARQLCGFAAPSGNPASIANAADILFPVQTPAGYGSVTGVGIFSAVTAGTLLYWVAITPKTFAVSDQAKFAAGALTVSED